LPKNWVSVTGYRGDNKGGISEVLRHRNKNLQKEVRESWVI